MNGVDTSKEAVEVAKRLDAIADDASFYGADQRHVVELAEEAAAMIRALATRAEAAEARVRELGGAGRAALDYLTLLYNERVLEGQFSPEIIFDLSAALDKEPTP
jgi:hypothetical protein